MANPGADEAEIIVYSTTWCPDCKQVKQFFGEQRIPYVNIDIEEDADGMAFVERANAGKHIVPTVAFPDGSTLAEPSNAQLAEKLGLQTIPKRQFYDVVIVGGGPAGLTAALYLAREGLETLVVERSGLGGQVGTSQWMENFPGFDEGVSGVEFADRLTRQARRFGVEILQATEIRSLSPEGPYVCAATTGSLEVGSRALLLASGARYRRLEVPGEAELIGTNIHFCATCDGVFYKDQKVLVVGGGNSGFEEGLFLTRFASQVDIVEYEPQVKASLVLQEQVARMPNMNVTVNHAVQAFRGGKKSVQVQVQDRATGQIKEWEYAGVFVFIGLTPNSGLMQGKAELDDYGFVKTDRTLMTTCPGVFAAGDVRAGSTKQAAAAAGEGVTVALMIREYLRNR